MVVVAISLGSGVRTALVMAGSTQMSMLPPQTFPDPQPLGREMLTSIWIMFQPQTGSASLVLGTLPSGWHLELICLTLVEFQH